MSDRNRVIDRFLGDETTPISWASPEEQQLHFWLDDLHCPQPISPMWFDIGGWWYTCHYMYRRFGVPFGKDWVGKTVGGYVMSAVVPRDPTEEAELAPYFGMVMPVYADKFLGWWKAGAIFWRLSMPKRQTIPAEIQEEVQKLIDEFNNSELKESTSLLSAFFPKKIKRGYSA
jgi:hypothetical protein